VDSFARERNTKLHAVTDAKGRPIRFFMSAGQVSDYTGAAALLGGLPQADWLLADRGYDADWIRRALEDRGISACIPGRKSRKETVKYDKRRYKRRNRIEIMFGRLKDWRRVATRYDRCPETYLSAIALAATVLFWLRSRTSLDPKKRQGGT
jgi:transposase